MKITDLSGKYIAKYLSEKEVPQILELCKGNPQYYEHCPPLVSEETITKDMSALPPRKTMKDKHYFGFFDGETLVAIVDLIERFPNENTAFIGFFMMNKDYQGRGIGSAVITDISFSLTQEFKYIRLGYVETNMQAKKFWMKNGFKNTGHKSKEELYTVIILEKVL
ncbi:MAG: GNAT family N-acetyltransferase [Clostridia bacterium]|nr:GNAT family N-acetyltransferase [Clostridia bacterium]